MQAETREVLKKVIHRLKRLEASPVPKFVVGLDEMTVAPHKSTIGLDELPGALDVVMGPGVYCVEARDYLTNLG